LTLAYRELRARVDTSLLRAGEVARGHEFHWSVLEAPLTAGDAAYDILQQSEAQEGFARGHILASYCHLHFGSNPALAPTFVEAARISAT
jgi:cobyrinic acid a,c-diamide synthase